MSAPTPSTLDGNQVLQGSFDESTGALRIEGIASGGNGINVDVQNTLITQPFDYISATYPTTTQEVYVYKLGGSSGTLVGTITVNYTDTSKNFVLNIAKT